MSPRLLLVVALLLLPAAHAQQAADAGPSSAQLAAHQFYSRRLAGTLAGQGDARSLALAALLRQAEARNAAEEGAEPAPDAQAMEWLRAANAGAGRDVLANRLLVAAAAGAEPIAGEAARRWRDTDPGNLHPLLLDGAGPDALLSAARSATRADARMYDSVRWIMSAYRKHPPTAQEQALLAGGDDYRVDEAAAIAAMGLWASTARPGFAALFDACSAQALHAVPARRDDCRHAARLLADRSGNVGDEQAGLSMLYALATDAAERAAIAGRLRSLDWRMLQWGEAAQRQPRGGAAQFARLLDDSSIATEQQLVARVLQEAGVSPEPPAGWTPPRR